MRDQRDLTAERSSEPRAEIFSNFDPADAFTYWNLIGLQVDPNRITQVHVDSSSSPLVDITADDDWFYTGARGYAPVAGLGVLNVANLAAAVRHESRR